MTRRQKIGLAILAAIAAGLVIWYSFIRDDHPDPDVPTVGPAITVTGYSSPLKGDFLNDPDVQQILKDRYNITVENTSSSTRPMLCEVDISEADYVWIGDTSQIEDFEKCRNMSASHTSVFFSPVVIYSWANSVDLLIAAGVVTIDPDGTYRVDMIQLLDIIEERATWQDLGDPNRTKPVIVETTDPNASTSGGHFAALLASTMVCHAPVSKDNVESILPDINEYFIRLGNMETSTRELYRLYMSVGEGGYPMIAAYESQIVEFMLENPGAVDQVQNEIRMLYPEPTVFITHPLVSLTSEGRRLRDALLDPDIQRLAWEKNGFRPSEPGVQIDLTLVPTDIPARIERFTDIPIGSVMTQILEATDTSATSSYVPDPNPPPRPVCAQPDQAPIPEATPISSSSIEHMHRRPEHGTWAA